MVASATVIDGQDRSDETALLQALRAGDELAYEQLVRQHAGMLLLTARRILQNEDDARDAVQDAFLSAFRALGSFAGNSRLATWLHRIVINAALNKLRRRQRKPERSIDDLLPSFQEDGHQANPAVEWREDSQTALQRQETRTLVREAIDTLPDLYRTVLLLRDIEGLETEEAAQVLGVNSAVVKTRLHRARQALRTILDPHFRGGAL
jgi:RNA polymerase sigma-70 factor (ECF subfamily)